MIKVTSILSHDEHGVIIQDRQCSLGVMSPVPASDLRVKISLLKGTEGDFKPGPCLSLVQVVLKSIESFFYIVEGVGIGQPKEPFSILSEIDTGCHSDPGIL